MIGWMLVGGSLERAESSIEGAAKVEAAARAIKVIDFKLNILNEDAEQRGINTSESELKA